MTEMPHKSNMNLMIIVEATLKLSSISLLNLSTRHSIDDMLCRSCILVSVNTEISMSDIILLLTKTKNKQQRKAQFQSFSLRHIILSCNTQPLYPTNLFILLLYYYLLLNCKILLPQA